MVYQLLPAGRNERVQEKTGWFFALSCLLNAAWIFAWHYQQFLLSLLIMLALLTTLIFIYLRLDRHNPRISAAEKWLLNLPFSIYLGWITVASLANLMVLVKVYGLVPPGLASLRLTIVVVILAAVLAGWIIVRQRDYWYGLVFVWALVGIALKNASLPGLRVMALNAAAVLLFLDIYLPWRK